MIFPPLYWPMIECFSVTAVTECVIYTTGAKFSGVSKIFLSFS